MAGDWYMPSMEGTKQAALVIEPEHDIEVHVSPRKGLEDGCWTFGLKNSGTIFTIVSEDAEKVSASTC